MSPPVSPSPDLPAAVLDQLAAAVAVVGPDWRLQYVSAPGAAILGRRPEDLIGADVWALIPSATGTEQQERLVKAMTDRTPDRLEWFSVLLDLWLTVRVVPTGDGLLALVDDITEQRATARRAARLVEVGEALAGARDAAAVNDIVLRRATPLVGAAGGTIALADDERGALCAVGWRGFEVGAGWDEHRLTQECAASAAYTRAEPVLLGSLPEVETVCPDCAVSLRAAGQQALAAMPLFSAGARIGVLIVTFEAPTTLSDADWQFLVTTAAMAAQALLRARLIDVETRSIDALQRSLLPRALPPVTGLETAVRYLPANATAQIGGDWYDVIPLASGAVALVLGDVEGHDLGAAALMGLVRSAVRAYALDGHPPAIVLARANSFLASLELDRIVTLSYAQLHPMEQLVVAVSAGHPPTIVVTPAGGLAEVPSDVGPPLGVFDDGQLWSEMTSTLPEGCAFAMYTDGLVEERGVSIDVGMDRVRGALRTHATAPVEELADALLAVRAGGHDDTALITGRLTAVGGAPRRLGRRLPATPASVPLSRAFARQLLKAWHVEQEVIERAELIVSELVTNAARHSEDALEVAVEHRDTIIRLEVGDSSHRMPLEPTAHVAEDATSGRGLLLVAAVASRWGVESEGLSKLVWAELDL